MSADPTQVLRQQVSELLDRRRLGHARTLLAQGLGQAPDDTGLLFEAARADWLEDRHGDMHTTLQRLLALEPGHYGGRALLFELLQHEGRLPEAEEVVLGLLREHPRESWLYAAYARLMLRALLFDKARQLAAEALRLDPEAEAALRAQALCDLTSRSRNRDSAALLRMLEDNPDDYHTLELVCIGLVREGRIREAHALAQQLLRARPGDPHALARVRELRMQSHWTLWPMWPMQRFGWAGAISMWVLTVVVLRITSKTAPALAAVLSPVLLGYVVYTWVWPPLLRRWVSRD